LLADAVAAGVAIEAVFAEPAAREQARALVGDGVPVYTVSDRTLASAADPVTPQGLAAIARRPEIDLDVVLRRSLDTRRPVLVLVDVSDPGNLGTLIRVAEAAGAAAVLSCAGSADPWSPKVVRASAGALFRVDVVSGGEPVQVVGRAGALGLRRVGTAAGRGVPHDRADLTGAFALVLGNEARGLSPPVVDAVDEWVHIEMDGRVESLNVAMAGAVLCFEARRQRTQGDR
jgi:TrmH family RNA methyltransferase